MKNLTITNLPNVGTVSLYGVPIVALSELECVKFIMDEIESNQGGWCVTVNLNILRQIVLYPEIQHLVNNCNFFTADGISLVWASRILGNPLPERVCGCDLIYSLTEEAARRHSSVFFLGGNPGVAEKAALDLKRRYEKLIVAGTYCPSFGFESNPKEIEEMAQLIGSCQPDIIYVALGFPKQEKLIALLRHVAPNAWWIGVGVSFSYVALEFKRAPLWVQKFGLETFYRVTLEPQRLTKRYLVENPPFVARLLINSLLTRLGIIKRSQ